MTYRLQVHALSPVRPTAAELLAHAAGWGFVVEAAGAAPGDWTSLTLKATGPAGTAFTVRVESDLAGAHAALRRRLEDGEDIPEQVFASSCLYDLDLPAWPVAEGEDESSAAAFVAVAHGLASLTDGLVVDPQEGLIADADSFGALVLGGDDDWDDDGGEDGDDDDWDDDDGDEDDGDETDLDQGDDAGGSARPEFAPDATSPT